MHIGSIFIAKVAKMAVGMDDFVFCGGWKVGVYQDFKYFPQNLIISTG